MRTEPGPGYDLSPRKGAPVNVVHGTEQLAGPLGAVLTIGNFDGVHRGHRALIERTLQVAATYGAPAAALTFHPAPREVLDPDRAVPRIQTLRQRLDLLERAGLDQVVVQAFTAELASMGPEAFARQILAERIGVRAFVLGHDFRFGRRRAGDARMLHEVLDVPVHEVAALMEGDLPISSSRIRQALQEGDVAAATVLLGRPHVVEGTVGPGDQRGRALGFPTANVGAVEGLVPRSGVYAVRATAAGETYPAVANLGVRPTFGGASPAFEVHLLDFTGDLYDQPLQVSFVARLRDERRFDSVEALVAAIREDAAEARRMLAS